MAERDNQTWLEALRGKYGFERQRLAHQDLGKYLHKVVYNYLLMRQANLPALSSFSMEELAVLAQDFVQEALEKLAGNNFALLHQFEGRGRFTSWAAQIARRQAGQELRKAHWQRRITLSAEENETDDRQKLTFEQIVSEEIPPENAAMRQEVRGQLERCIKELPERGRLAFWECVANEQGIELVAERLQVTANAVYLLIYRAKRQLKKCLHQNGFDDSILDLYEQSNSPPKL
jgi:RNA polymerase sigma-70 factor (ECF subfamily)